MPKKTVTLISLKENQNGVITSISGGRNVIQRLTDMGLTPGTEIKILRNDILCPIEISVRGSKLALGRGIAAKILVKVK
jgi:Fe2+ transport system protein FeoA